MCHFSVLFSSLLVILFSSFLNDILFPKVNPHVCVLFLFCSLFATQFQLCTAQIPLPFNHVKLESVMLCHEYIENSMKWMIFL